MAGPRSSTKIGRVEEYLRQNGTDKTFADAKAALDFEFSDTTFGEARKNIRAEQVRASGETATATAAG